MERFDRNISTFQPALQERPKVFEPIRMHLPVYISIGMIDDLVRVLGSESEVGTPFIGVEFRPWMHMLPYDGLHRLPFAILNHFRPDVAATLKDSDHDGLSARATL